MVEVMIEMMCLVHYICSSKSAIHVDDCFKFERYHMLKGYNQQNFVLNTIWIIHHFIWSDDAS